MTPTDPHYLAGRTQSAYLAIALAAALAIAVGPNPTALNRFLVVAIVAVLQVVIAFAPSFVVGRAAVAMSPLPGLLSAGIATAITLKPSLLAKATAEGQWTGEVAGNSNSLIGVIPGIAAGLIAGAIVASRRPIGRDGLFAALAWSACIATLSAFAVGWIAVLGTSSGPLATWIGAAAVIVSVVVWSLPLPTLLGAAAALIAGSLAGAAVVQARDAGVPILAGAAIGSAVALSAVLGQVLARGVGDQRRNAPVYWAFPGACSVAIAGPVVLVGGELAGAALW